MIHRALTVCQPFAWALMFGPKRVENRGWSTSYRGPLAIHAGKSTAWLHCVDDFPAGLAVPSVFDFGAVLGFMDLVDIIRPEEVSPDRGNITRQRRFWQTRRYRSLRSGLATSR